MSNQTLYQTLSHTVIVTHLLTITNLFNILINYIKIKQVIGENRQMLAHYLTLNTSVCTVTAS